MECGAPGIWRFILHVDGTLDLLCDACDLQMVADAFRWPQHLRLEDRYPVRPLSALRAEWKEKYGDAHNI